MIQISCVVRKYREVDFYTVRAHLYLRYTTRAKELKVHPRVLNTLRLQYLLHADHEIRRPAHEVLSLFVTHEQILLLVELRDVHPARMVVVHTLHVLCGGRRREEHRVHVRVGLHDLGDVRGERAHLLGARGVYPRDGPCGTGLDERVQNRHHAREPDARGEEYDGRVLWLRTGIEEEVAIRVRDLQDVALVLLVMENVRDVARVRT